LHQLTQPADYPENKKVWSAAEALARIKAERRGEQDGAGGRRLLRLGLAYVKPERRCVMRLEEEAPAA
ncbi:MAG: hypothetical protein HUK26_06030, partial [Duodenibacillus sp.]|nr:hypothetical protein [Duodenibacillus sp.]